MTEPGRCRRRERPRGPPREIAYAREYTQRTLRDDPVPVRDDARAGRLAEAHQIGPLGRKALPRSEPESRVVAVDDAVAELDLDALDEIVRHEVVEHGAGGLGEERAGEISVGLRALVRDSDLLDPEPPERIVHGDQALRG